MMDRSFASKGRKCSVHLSLECDSSFISYGNLDKVVMTETADVQATIAIYADTSTTRPAISLQVRIPH